jgi:hypothetical protein
MADDIGFSDEIVPTSRRASPRSVQAAVSLKIAGASYQEIAETLNYVSPATARAAVEQGLADAYEAKDTASLRRITSARLEALWRLAWKNAEIEEVEVWRGSGEDTYPVMVRNPEQAAYIRLGMDIAGRYAKLHGLDAPTQLSISPGAVELEETVTLLVAAAKRGTPAEADIFAEEEIVDADVVPGPEDEPDA